VWFSLFYISYVLYFSSERPAGDFCNHAGAIFWRVFNHPCKIDIAPAFVSRGIICPAAIARAVMYEYINPDP
jgi:hypothetical protein